jgi:hypothetical protein
LYEGPSIKRKHIITDLGSLEIPSITRDLLQQYLEQKAALGLSFSVVDHLRWDLRSFSDWPLTIASSRITLPMLFMAFSAEMRYPPLQRPRPPGHPTQIPSFPQPSNLTTAVNETAEFRSEQVRNSTVCH